jgi:hypothetical protein
MSFGTGAENSCDIPSCASAGEFLLQGQLLSRSFGIVRRNSVANLSHDLQVRVTRANYRPPINRCDVFFLSLSRPQTLGAWMKLKGCLFATIVCGLAAGPAFGQAATAPTGVPLNNVWTYKGVTITLGGFLAFETVYRSRNQLGDIGSTFGGIPFFNSPLSHMQEFRETAQQSRVAGLVQGNPDATTHLAMYGEFDFLAGPGSANQNESNSFSPRIRHLYGTAD